ncbi:MAG TPA: efflux RND transporter periplasmic adaptor subunit [Gemmatimonadaceae bacterium]|nr:efflux RND transporter periplasmic adaptor subunit [Gemmatimonadaceae bacterium]
MNDDAGATRANTPADPADGNGGRDSRVTRRPQRSRALIIGGIVAIAVASAFALWRLVPHQAVGGASGAAVASAGGMSGMNMSSDGTVELTANQMRQFGVTFGGVEERTLENTVRTAGVVTIDETTLADVTPRFGGYVERLYVDATGQRVRHGQPLMEIYSPELVAAEQELLVAAKLQQSIGGSDVPGVPAVSTDLVAAAKRRFALWDISEEQVAEILRTGTMRRTLTLYAPASGTVLEKHVVQGQAIQPGAVLYRIANLRHVWIDVALREQDAGAVRIGSHAIVELASYPGRPIDGRVAYVYPTLDSTARAVRARIEVSNPDGRLKPGMYATVTLTTPSRRALTVPTSAVLNTGDRTLVFTDMGGGRLMPMEVVTGRTAGAYTEVLSGLEPGQRVVTSAQYLLDSESNLSEVMKSMLGQMDMSGGSRGGQMNTVGGMKDMPGMNDTGADMRGMDTKGMTMPPSPTTPRR